MTEAESLADQLYGLFQLENGWHVPVTRALRGLSAAQAAWRPEGQPYSIWDLVNHMRYEMEVVLARFTGTPEPEPAAGDHPNWPPAGAPGADEAWTVAVFALIAVHHALVKHTAGLSPGVLDSPPPGRRTPRRKVIQGMIGHNSYHAGQIVLLRRLQGNWEIWDGNP